ncbi:Hypothetical predicted protein [Mytilus galloprovincialis]|uniref:IRG-type G domain-containing protein n=1 Tax=Mytilus galloprovincialis TaxID=29158 RepID=A0A8B6CJA0_MYTGA|nr:Hypothetical predicted protein [Mytilus galloprovincialis]
MEQMKSNESTCLGTIDDKSCRNIITNDVRFCSNCGLKNPQYVSEEKQFNKIDGLKESSQRKDVKEQSEEISSTASEQGDINPTENVKANTSMSCTNDVNDSDILLEATISSLQDANDPDKLMMKLRNQRIKFAVTGRSGIGKSTFINLVRDVNHGDPEFADVGFGDCTSSQTEYKHPRNEHISFVDLPGFGTDTFTKKMFSDSYDLSVFDFCLIFIESVIMEDDVWIVKKLKAGGIPYCFIRSKIDVNISMAEHMGKKENEVVNEIRKMLQTKISKHDVLSGSRIFLISNIKTFFHISDFKELFSFITENLDREKRESLVFFLPILSPDMIDKKFDMLRKRIDDITICAAAIAAIPVPFLDTAINMIMVNKEVKYYIKAFMLDKEYVEKIPGVKRRQASKRNIETYVKSGLVSAVRLGFTVLIKSVFASNATHVYVHYFLLKSLEEIKRDALTVYEFYTKHIQRE